MFLFHYIYFFLFYIWTNKSFPACDDNDCFSGLILFLLLSKYSSDDRNLASSGYPSKWFWQVNQADTQYRWPQLWPRTDKYCRLVQLWQVQISILQEKILHARILDGMRSGHVNCLVLKNSFVWLAVMYLTCKGLYTKNIKRLASVTFVI